MDDRQVAISVDVDTLRYYANFAPNGVVGADPILSYTMPRLLDLFAELEIQATLFVIGDTILPHKTLWRRAFEAGHELASHTQTHVQAFHLLSKKEKRYEIEASKQNLENCIGQPVLGFRAPAYNIDLDTLDLLVEAGYQYDSSLFPGWFLPVSKIVTPLISRTYRPVPTSPLHWQYRQVPHGPFRWTLAGQNLVEIPLPTTRFGKPFFGTIHLNFPKRFFISEVNWLAQHRPIIPYELHPIEVIDEYVLSQAPWVRNIPGVGKYDDPWDFLRFRLQKLTHLGTVIQLREIPAYDTQIVYPGAG